MSKYSKDGPFTEPIVRCDSCAKIIRVEKLKKLGYCPECSNTRIRNVRSLKPEEMEQVKEWGIDPEWIALFEATKEDE